MKYEILDVDALGRIGKLEVNNKQMITPNLFPVVHPFKNVIPPSDLKKFGAQSIFTNAYILFKNEAAKENVLKKKIHQYLDFDGLIATDSGAFQQYMYNDKKMEINPSDIEGFQEEICSDFPVILDIPVQLDDTYETAEFKVNETIKRAKENIIRRRNANCNWFGPIHGGRHKDLLKRSSLEMNNLDFAIYAIGGLVKAFLDYRFELTLDVLLTVKKNVIPNKPIHMFGLGLPQFFSLAVVCGCDLMDSAAYILYAKENRYFTLSTGTKNIEKLTEFPCHCPICVKYKPNEVMGFEDNLKTQLLAKHNLYLSFSELKTIRQAIREGNLWELVEQRIRNHPNLVKAFNIVKKNLDIFESHEKLYKISGRLFASSESIHRPLIHRYIKRLATNYRPPKDSRYLIILPQLDVKGPSSPTINSWLDEIDRNKIIPRSAIHVVFLSNFLGIIPLDLIDTYPMGQYEAIGIAEIKDSIYENCLLKAEVYFRSLAKSYKKFGILIPEIFINQYQENIKFYEDHPICGLEDLFKRKYNLNFSISSNIEDILLFFKAD
ncbi:MAG: tRNA guanosine(15) transglycosylase TgtA [Candidatus Lokiarchaeota archaeon]|nr:tRNA guanosine(15) transglycosylase TgtA [Candidatus Lokiarchaeota archaeon]